MVETVPLWIFNILLLIVAWLGKDKLKALAKDNADLRADNKELREKVDKLEHNYLDRFEEVNENINKLSREVLTELGKGAVIFAEIRSDIGHIMQRFNHRRHRP